MKRTIAGLAAGVLGGLLLGAPVYSFGYEQGTARPEHGRMGQTMSDADMRAHMKECEGTMGQMGSMMHGDMGSMMQGDMGSMEMIGADT